MSNFLISIEYVLLKGLETSITFMFKSVRGKIAVKMNKEKLFCVHMQKE